MKGKNTAWTILLSSIAVATTLYGTGILLLQRKSGGGPALFGSLSAIASCILVGGLVSFASYKKRS